MGTDYPAAGRDAAGESHIFLMFLGDVSGSAVAFFLHPAVSMIENTWPRERSVLILEAADVLGVSRRTVYYRIREGRLQTIRTRGGSQRVLWSSIEALLRSMRPALGGDRLAADPTPVER